MNRTSKKCPVTGCLPHWKLWPVAGVVESDRGWEWRTVVDDRFGGRGGVRWWSMEIEHQGEMRGMRMRIGVESGP